MTPRVWAQARTMLDASVGGVLLTAKRTKGRLARIDHAVERQLAAVVLPGHVGQRVVAALTAPGTVV